MFESINGQLKEKTPSKIVIECSGIGYRIGIPLSVYTKLPVENGEIFLYLSQVLREDAQFLYGFLEKEERDLFESLLQVSGVGARTAIGILGHMEAITFQQAILSADIPSLSKLPGIGKKTAERLILEMRDRMKHLAPPPFGSLSSTRVVQDAVQALTHLGYSLAIAQKAVQAASQTDPPSDLQKLIVAALQHI